jgi:hypothetical protein
VPPLPSLPALGNGAFGGATWGAAGLPGGGLATPLPSLWGLGGAGADWGAPRRDAAPELCAEPPPQVLELLGEQATDTQQQQRMMGGATWR